MTWYAALNSSKVVVKSFDVRKQSDVALNTPAGCTAMATNGPQQVGATYAAGQFTIAAPIESAVQTLDRMLDTVDDERELRMMNLLTAGGAKKYEYANKAREVRDYRSMNSTLLAALLLPLNMAGTRERFAWAMAEADETGDSLEVVITRYEAAMNTTNLVRKVAARAQKLRRQLRAATTTTARTTIFNARSWPTS